MKKHTKKINGHEYEVMSLAVIPNYALFTKFGAVMGDSLESFCSLADKKGFAGVGKGISQILKALHENDSNGDMLLELLSQTTRDGKAINRSNIDAFYMGNIEEMMEALVESINVHFKGFLFLSRFSGVLSKLGFVKIESSGS